MTSAEFKELRSNRHVQWWPPPIDEPWVCPECLSIGSVQASYPAWFDSSFELIDVDVEASPDFYCGTCDSTYPPLPIPDSGDPALIRRIFEGLWDLD